MNYSRLLDLELLRALAHQAGVVGAASASMREEVLRALEVLFPNLPTDVWVLREAHNAHVPDALQELPECELDLESFYTLEEDLRSRTRFSPEMAQVAVLAWAQALGVRLGAGVPKLIPAPDIVEVLAPNSPQAQFGAPALGLAPSVPVGTPHPRGAEPNTPIGKEESSPVDPDTLPPQPPRTRLPPPIQPKAPAPPQPATKWFLPPQFVLTPEVRDTFAYVENGSGHLLLTGKAGTGKSTWLHFFALHTQKNFVVLAPTGLSAVNVGGATLHSFFGFPLRPLLPNDAEIRRFGRKSGKMDLIQSTDVIIIDEISMVRADVLDAVDYSLRLNLRNDEPFGGKQVVFIGDVFQLPPVVSGQHELERQLYPTLFPNDSPPEGWLFTEGNGAYDSPFFFSARVFRKSPISYQVLKEIFRQRDPEFITLLNRVRQGQPRPEDMEALNSRVVPGYTPPPEHIAVTLVTTNALAKRLNETALEALPGTERTYRALREGSFDARWQPADDPLTLKPGAQVLFTRNHPTGLWVNGTLGVVEKLGDDTIVVRTRAGELLEVSPTMWEHTEYVWNKDTRRVDSLIKGTFTQFPLRLAWALTIHKSQGMTFDEVVLDLGRGAFAHGQLYVALSRCRTFQGLTLRQPVRTTDAKVDPVVLEFVRSLPR